MSQTPNRPDGGAPAGHRPSDPIANLVGDALAAPAMPSDLQARLSARLDAEFAHANDPLNAARNGTLASLLQKKYECLSDPPPAAVERGEMSRLRCELHDLAAPPEERMGVGRRFALVGAAAAVVLAACFCSQPGFRWSEVVESVRSQPQVMVSLQSDGPADETLVIATRQDPSAKRRPTTASYLHLSGELLPRVSGDRNANRLSAARGADEVEADLVAALLECSGLSADDDRAGLKVRDSWPRSAPDGVELDLAIARGDQLIHATLLLDAASKLPLRCELRPQGGPPKQLQFTYADGAVDAPAN